LLRKPVAKQLWRSIPDANAAGMIVTGETDMGAAWTQEHALRIYKLAKEIVEEAANMLEHDAATTPHEGGLIVDVPQGANVSVENDYLVLRAETFYKVRRQRELVFGEKDLFSDPCWDILLDLFIAHRRNQDISVTSACLAAQVPATTALRWMTVLEKLGLIERQKDTADSRRRFVRLTDKAIAQVSDILEGAA